MSKLFIVKVAAKAAKEVNVLAETPEEAQAKVQLAEGEVVESVEEKGDVVA